MVENRKRRRAMTSAHPDRATAADPVLSERLVSLDAYPLPRPVSFIKIDVEGAEPQALRGASQLLREDRPVVISEVHPSQLERVSGMSPAGLIRQMHGLGYRCHLLGAGRLGKEIRDVHASGVTSVVFVSQ